MILERATLPRHERLRRRTEFERLYRTGTRTEAAGVLLVWRPGGPGRRAGVVASRRLGGSVERNRARRWLREAYRLNKGVLPEGLDIILVARSDLWEGSFDRLCRGVAAGFRSVKLRLASPGNGGGSTT